MKQVFVILDEIIQSYYTSYRGDEAWARNIGEAKQFDSEEEVLEYIDMTRTSDWGGSLPDCTIITIKPIWIKK